MNRNFKKWLILCIIVMIALTSLLLVACKKPVEKCDNISNITDCDYDISLKIDPREKSLSRTVNITFRYNGGSADAIDLLFNANVFSNKTPAEPSEMNVAYPLGASYGETNIVSVTYNGNAATHILADNQLTVMPKKGKIATGKISIGVDYSLKLPYNRLRYGVNQYSMQIANFYPQIARIDEYSVIGDPFYSNVADYQVKVTYPNGNKLVASGDLVDGSSDESMTVANYSAVNIRDFALVLGQNGRIITKKSSKGYTVNYYYNKDNNPEQALNTATSALDTFTELYGDYHHKSLNLVEVDFAMGGMEFGGLIYIAMNMNAENRQNVIIHETAHQWWYGNVGSDQVNHAWQDEGLTEFSVEMYFSYNNLQERAAKYQNLSKQSMKEYINYATDKGVAYDDRIDRALSDFVNSMEYLYNVYDKGYLMFVNVREIIGDKLFFSALRDYYKENLYKLAQPQDLFDAFNKHHSGTELVFKSWLNGNVISTL